MQVQLNHSIFLILKLNEEEVVLNIPDPIYIYKVGDEISVNIMRPEKEEKYELVKVVVTNVEYQVLDYGEAEQIIKVMVEKVNDTVSGTSPI